MNTRFVTHPTEEHLKQIEDWLFAERQKTGEGFYCNLSAILAAHQQKELACITHDNEAIGFAAWINSKPLAHLDIVEIHPDLRERGFGRILIEGLFNYLRTLGIVVVDLECQPPTSEPVWRHLGFRDFPKAIKHDNDSINLYRPLIENLEATSQSEDVNNQSGDVEVLELWDKEPYPAQNSAPTWTWQILRQAGTQKLVKPIIHPCDCRWKLQWRQGKGIFANKKVKSFSKESEGWIRYIVLTELPEYQGLSLE